MEGATSKGVLDHLEVLARRRWSEAQQSARVKELKAKAAALVKQRDQLKAQIQTQKNLQKLRLSMENHSDDEEEETDEDSDSSQLLRLMARHTHLRDLLDAHHLIGGYDVVKTSQGKGVCVSLATAYEGIYLDTYNLELDLKPKLRIRRHNIPPFIPLSDLAEQNDMEANLKPFLDLLSQHLNAFAGRKQQLKLVKERHTSVEVMESNVLCSILVLMLTVPRQRSAVLCKLDYTDHTRLLPTHVSFESEDKELLNSPEWKRNRSLLKETPVHKALTTMKTMSYIV